MKQQIALEPALVLHTRAYRDTSFIIELFSKHQGRVPVVARGARTRKTWQGLCQPFVPVLVSWIGKEELMTLKDIEANGISYWLTGRKLLSGFYLNELLVRLLPRHDPHPLLFDYYQQALVALMQPEDEQYALRLFEKHLLDELGYGLALSHETGSETAIESDAMYHYVPQLGVSKTTLELMTERPNEQFSGKTLLAIEAGKWSQVDMAQAKRLMRQALAPLLGDKPLRTRELFRSG
jgi:DNA repair protein RecO (recombination protein O)